MAGIMNKIGETIHVGGNKPVQQQQYPGGEGQRKEGGGLMAKVKAKIPGVGGQRQQEQHQYGGQHQADQQYQGGGVGQRKEGGGLMDKIAGFGGQHQGGGVGQHRTDQQYQGGGEGQRKEGGGLTDKLRGIIPGAGGVK